MSPGINMVTQGTGSKGLMRKLDLIDGREMVNAFLKVIIGFSNNRVDLISYPIVRGR
jgi:hypothetical protein